MSDICCFDTDVLSCFLVPKPGDADWEQKNKIATTLIRGGHSTGTGIRRDYTKQNLCQIAGYKLLTFDADMVKSGQALDFTERMLRGDNG